MFGRSSKSLDACKYMLTTYQLDLTEGIERGGGWKVKYKIRAGKRVRIGGKFVTLISVIVFVMEDGEDEGGPVFFTIRKKTGRVTHHFRVGLHR